MPIKKERSIRVELSTDQIGTSPASMQNCSGTIQLTFRNDTLSQMIEYGDLLAVQASVRRVSKNLNPDAFDFQKYLNHKNIHFQSFVSSDNWARLDSNQCSPVLAWAHSTREQLIEIIKEEVPSKNESGVASALILGYKEELSTDLKNAYSKTGAMHVLAVSGLHVGMIWGILAFLLKWIRWKHPIWRWLKTGVIILCLWGFALLTGASSSVLRAATMFSFLLVGNAMIRNTNIYNTLAAAAFCLLLTNPYLIVDVGFQLSFLAVTGIIYFYRKIYGLWYIENRVGDYLWQLTAVAIAAQLSTFPLTMYYFHQFPAYFWLSGLVVVPFAFFILDLG